MSINRTHIHTTSPQGKVYVRITGTCEIESTEYSVTVEEDRLLRYLRGGVSIQQLFPNLTPAQREFIMTGTTPAEWDSIHHEVDDTE
jgi:hypothetical protein